MPRFEPVDRNRELREILETCTDNWNDDSVSGKAVLPFAPQAQGTGKTFLGKFLPAFIRKDSLREESSVRMMIQQKFPLFGTHLLALHNTRSVVISFGDLYKDCTSLDEAICVSIADLICGSVGGGRWNPLVRGTSLALVRENRLHFEDICRGISAQEGAIIVVLDDIPDLILNSNCAHWLQDKEGSAEISAMAAIRDLVSGALTFPGVVIYLTGRAPQMTYKLMTTMSTSPVIATAILIDALQQKDVEELLNGKAIDKVSVSLRAQLGLRDDAEVEQLATYLLHHTAGVARVLTTAVDVISKHNWLLLRRADQSVWDVLGTKTVTDVLYSKLQGGVFYGIVPNWSLQLGGVSSTPRAHCSRC